MDGAYARAGQHGKHRLGNHGHVNQHAVAFFDAQAQKRCRHALHLTVQLGKGVGALGVGLCRYGDQRVLVRAVPEVAVHRVVAQIGSAAHKPARKRRIAVVANLGGRRVPLNALGLFGPKTIPVLDGTAVKFGVSGHIVVSKRILKSVQN